MSGSPPPSPTSHATAHAYASNGLEMLQAASDAAHAINHQINSPQALQHAAVAAAEVVGHQQHHQSIDPTSPPDGLPHAPTDLSGHLIPGPGGVMRDPTINPKLTRLRRACDMCSMRKVKCDDSNIPCRPCRELGVDCTFNRETKRRGPPNKHAEAAKAAKRARMDTSAVATAAAVFGAMSPSPQTAAKTLMNISTEGVLDAESIAPMPVLELLVDDFFTYIHPLAPFPHEPTFRQSFANREDRTRPEFLGLLASMICALVASFPRSAREHLKAQHSTHLFPQAIVMIEKCREIALLTRGSKWQLKQPKTLDDAATSYFLGLASGYSHQWNASGQFMAETLTLLRELGFNRPKHPGDLPTFGNDNCSPDPLPFNHVKDQIGKRIFYCLLLGVRSFSQLGASSADMVIAPSTPSLPYPAYPENVDDICVLANEVIHQQDGSVTLLTGFRFAIDIYTTMNGIVSLELAYGMSTLPWADQRILLRDGLIAAKSITDNLPPELQLGNHGDEAATLASFDESGMQYVPPAWPNSQPAHDLRNVIKNHPARRRHLQYEIQKANIFVSQLATRSYFVELYFDLRDVHLSEQQQDNPIEGHSEEEKAAQDADEKEIHEFMSAERELIVQGLLTVLGSISQRNMEPNGGSLINKIRQVASTLLNDAPERKGPFAIKSEEALSQLINILMKLEKTSASGGAGVDPTDPNQMTSQDEEEELRNWADLRDYQLRFAAHGGFAGNL
ncbi:xylanolytic transcriptional activator xlnr [Fusarium albosuccineum]|uniref:Xylanolytic transcriptional activator xlnr n=1 Tax=Fusarium albosuccineum TaxID=1237068 RepID=A0A8H4PC28_9HYPO|nr:xylanolytic transcriptional activator xlnr [Fusarium albosuccineum]